MSPRQSVPLIEWSLKKWEMEGRGRGGAETNKHKYQLSKYWLLLINVMMSECFTASMFLHLGSPVVYISYAFSFKRVKRVFYLFGFKLYLFFPCWHNVVILLNTLFFLFAPVTVTNSSGPQTIIKTNHPASPVRDTYSSHLPGGLMQLEAGLLNWGDCPWKTLKYWTESLPLVSLLWQ